MTAPSSPITEDLEKLLNKRVKGVGSEHTDRYYIMLVTTYGKRFVFSSESPIYVEVEEEQ